MFKILNKKNHAFISQFIKASVSIDLTSSVNLFESKSQFLNEVKVMNPDQSLSLPMGILSDYLVKEPIKQVLETHNITFDLYENDNILSSLQQSFDLLMLDVSKVLTGYVMNESGRASFNKKTFASCVMQMVQLVINKKDPEVLLIYNKQTGCWMEGTQALKRLIIEMAYSAGENTDCWSVNLENAIIDIIKRKTMILESTNFDTSHFPFNNYSLQYDRGEMVEHSAKHFATFGSKVKYNPDSVAPIFESFLESIFDDDASRLFVMEWFGYSLSGSQKANSLLIGVGEGANGKSTLLELLGQLLNVGNVSSAPLSNFNTDFGLEPFIGKKLNLSTESDSDAFKTGRIKSVTAGESVSINRKNKKEVTMVLPTKLVFLMNELPLLTDASHGFERRLIILPFEKVFSSEEQDKDLPSKLNAELEGILNLAIKGLRRLISNNYRFTISEPMKAAKEKYIGVTNPIEKFLEACVEVRPGHTILSTELFQAYRTWAMTENLPLKGTGNNQVFWKMFKTAAELKLIDYTKNKSNGKTVVRDIDLK